jgi:hypothetical protein
VVPPVPRVYAQLWQRVSAEHMAQLGAGPAVGWSPAGIGAPPVIARPVRPASLHAPAPTYAPVGVAAPPAPAPPAPPSAPQPSQPPPPAPPPQRTWAQFHVYQEPEPSGEYFLNLNLRGRDQRRRTSTLLDVTTFSIAGVLALLALGLGVTVLAGHLLTGWQLFFVLQSAFTMLLVQAFASGLSALCTTTQSRLKERVRKLSTVTMAAVAWLGSLSGTFIGYAAYSAKPPPGAADLRRYPEQFLLSQPRLAFWDTFGMEWKLHLGWMTPFLATAVAFVALRYGRRVMADGQVRKLLTNVYVIAFATAVIAAALGAIVTVVAPNDFMH